MPVYYVQNFTYEGPGDSLCYGKQDAHNHKRANQFTVDVTEYLQNQGCQNIHPGKFMSNQPKPNHGKEFIWDDNQKKWVHV